MYIYLNGQIVKQEEAVISPFDHGFLYGIGLFETFRIYNGHPFLLDDHLNRLNNGLKDVNINFVVERNEILSCIQQLLEKNNSKHAYVRLNVSAGTGEIGLQTAPYNNPNVIIFSKPLTPPGNLKEKTVKLLDIRRNTPEGKERLKSHHYLNNVFAKREIGDTLETEGVFLTVDGFIAEGIVSNLFWVKGDVLFTPSVETGILNGVTRRFLIELAKKQALRVKEGFFLPEDVYAADEVFLTNSIQEIVPVSLFNGDRKPGSNGVMVQRLYQLYRKYCYSLWSREDIILEDDFYDR